MQQFNTLVKKELSTYFKSYFAYLIFFIYLFVSIGVAFYFGAYLAMHDAGAYALFYAQPIILVMLVPAVTMRLWSEEYRSGTAEFLLTQPVSDTKLALAKLTAAGAFLGGAALFLLPFLLYTATWLTLDLQNILLCFVGLELSVWALCTLGCLISSLNKNIITTYLLSVFAMALWVGLPFTGFYSAYNNFLFAELGWSDLLYFLLLSGCFIYLNILALIYRRTSLPHKTLKLSGFATLLLLGTGITLAAISNLADQKSDWTSAQLYTPKVQTAEILKLVDQPIEINIYAARDYISENTEYYHYFQQIQRFAEKYQNLTKGLISVNTVIVDAFSEMENNVLQKGLYYEENAHGSKNYFGAVVHQRDGQEYVIKQFLQERHPFVEKDIDSAILKILNPNIIKNIGVYMADNQALEPLESLFLNLENDYNLHNVNKNTYQLPTQLDLLILVNPKRLTDLFMYAIDQYIMRGGRVIIFYDFLTHSQTEIVNTDSLSIADFFNAWGIRLDNNYVSTGVLNPQFAAAGDNIKIIDATAFNLTDASEKLQILPFIYAKNGFIGGILSGHLDSFYQFNPYIEESFAAKMENFVPFNPEAQVALVGDVDILEEKNWVDPRSPDRNPYSIISTAANGEAVRALIDLMAGNEIYQILPINTYASNQKSVGQQINDTVYALHAAEYTKINDSIREINAVLYENSGNDINKMRQMLEISSAGESLAQQEKKAENMLYQMKREYSHTVARLFFIQAFLLPLGIVLLLFALIQLMFRRQKRNFLEQIND